MADSKTSSLLQFALIFLVVYLGTNFVMRTFFSDTNGNGAPKSGVIVEPVSAKVKGEHEASVVIRNFTEETLRIPEHCPMPPFDVWRMEQGERVSLSAEETALPCITLEDIAPGETVRYDLAPWKYSLFDEYATYQLALRAENLEDPPIASFSISEVGPMTRWFRTLVTKPLLNLLILIAAWTPGHNLGFSIILLTLIIKLILFFPTQHALEGQKKMQIIQPKIEALRSKYKNDPQRLNAETLKLWRQEKVNPFQSCLPMLLQFPVLIGLFYVIRDGSVLELSRHLLYEPHQDLAWQFGTNFLGMDLTRPNMFVFPPLLVVLQFLQMKLSFAINERKKTAKGTAQEKPKKKGKETESMMQTQQKVMQYGLPLMIGVFAFQFPAAVSLYWGISTLFAIGQQLVVNREHLPGNRQRTH